MCVCVTLVMMLDAVVEVGVSVSNGQIWLRVQNRTQEGGMRVGTLKMDDLPAEDGFAPALPPFYPSSSSSSSPPLFSFVFSWHPATSNVQLSEQHEEQRMEKDHTANVCVTGLALFAASSRRVIPFSSGFPPPHPYHVFPNLNLYRYSHLSAPLFTHAIITSYQQHSKRIHTSCR